MINANQWRVRSLRHFNQYELYTYIYLIIGAGLGAVYFIAGVVNTRIYQLLFNFQDWTLHASFLNVMLQIITLSILRVVLWLPQLFWQVMMGGAGFMDWLLAANIVRELV